MLLCCCKRLSDMDFEYWGGTKGYRVNMVSPYTDTHAMTTTMALSCCTTKFVVGIPLFDRYHRIFGRLDLVWTCWRGDLVWIYPHHYQPHPVPACLRELAFIATHSNADNMRQP
jgi:hypothetical protein